MQTQRNSRAAFTLVELLIATAITALIVVLLGTMFNSLTATSLRANQRIDAFRDARAALQMIQRDLSGLVRTQWEPDPFTTPAPSGGLQPITRPAAYLALTNLYPDPATGNQQIYALISLKNAGPGDLCSIGYYCSWDGAAYTLRRFFKGSSETFGTLSVPAPTPSPTPAGTPNVYISETALYRPNPTPTPPGQPDDILARYVWNLKIIAYDSAGNIIREDPANANSPPKYPFVCDFKDPQTQEIKPISPVGTAKPATIEISFRAMSSEAARAVIAAQVPASVWMDETDPAYKRLIAPNAYEFRTRIEL